MKHKHILPILLMGALGQQKAILKQLFGRHRVL